MVLKCSVFRWNPTICVVIAAWSVRGKRATMPIVHEDIIWHSSVWRYLIIFTFFSQDEKKSIWEKLAAQLKHFMLCYLIKILYTLYEEVINCTSKQISLSWYRLSQNHPNKAIPQSKTISRNGFSIGIFFQFAYSTLDLLKYYISDQEQILDMWIVNNVK